MKFYNETLNPKFYADGKMIPSIRKKLIDITNEFLKGINVDLPKIDDIQLTGSLANYNYNPSSDLDVHILLDFKKINDDKELVKTALDGIRFIWNAKHNINLKDHEVEMYFQDIKEPHVASGLYSLKKGDWVKKPEYVPPTVNDQDVKKKVKYFKFAINKLGEQVFKFKGNPKKQKLYYDYARRIFQKLKKMRQEGLSEDGEFSIGNLTFKVLRATNYIDKLASLVNDTFDNIYSEKASIHLGVKGRQERDAIKDPGSRTKHFGTIPDYRRAKDLPNSFKIMQRPGSPNKQIISSADAYKLAKHFGLKNVRRPKGLKKSGVALGQNLMGQFYLIKTNNNKNDYMV